MMIKTNQQPWVWAHQAEEYAAAVHQVRLLVSSTAVVAREHAEFSPAPTLAKTGSASPMTLLMVIVSVSILISVAVAVIMVAVVSNHLDRYSNSHLSSLNPTVVLEDVAVDGNRDTNSSSE
ncbi:hypothetical protein E3N88_37210 [Mikania micrantha]|uniref:Uncharacterized protein n=1 Tax=Mikania micrantha TaxID=192012 RepID=A0A5N6M5S6_9ASTR|nr:hypothetical protein E3N88_37210 [Mikania micrantha]